MREARNQRRASLQLLLVTLWITLLVLAVKVGIGWVTRSLSLLADALHTLIDSLSIILSLLTVTSMQRPLAKEGWSYGKRETISVLSLVAFLGFSGFSLLKLAIERLDASTPNQPLPVLPQINLPLIQLLGLAIAIQVCLVLFERYEARTLESSALRRNAEHMLRHVWLSIGMLIGLVAVSQGYYWLDSFMAIVLVLLAISSIWRVLNGQLPLLVQQVAIAPETLAQIAYQIEGVTRCHHIQSRGLVGRHIIVDMQLIVHPEFMPTAHLIAEQVEGAIRERYGPVQVKVRTSTETNRLEASRRSFKLSRMKRKRPSNRSMG